MWVVSATIYVSLSILLFLSFFIWKFFMYSFYFPLLLCALIFLALGLTSYWFALKK
ncbi:hypothetical protein DOK78_001313 [Enterococcus sp. DIV2402]|uniref:Uncharacterized protein n=1 Tax=Candidatus Enterococcus lowellii TaxID=2230877 RepID=A0ABZ2SLF9_9ENTE